MLFINYTRLCYKNRCVFFNIYYQWLQSTTSFNGTLHSIPSIKESVAKHLL